MSKRMRLFLFDINGRKHEYCNYVPEHEVPGIIFREMTISQNSPVRVVGGGFVVPKYIVSIDAVEAVD